MRRPQPQPLLNYSLLHINDIVHFDDSLDPSFYCTGTFTGTLLLLELNRMLEILFPYSTVRVQTAARVLWGRYVRALELPERTQKIAGPEGNYSSQCLSCDADIWSCACRSLRRGRKSCFLFAIRCGPGLRCGWAACHNAPTDPGGSPHIDTLLPIVPH